MTGQESHSKRALIVTAIFDILSCSIYPLGKQTRNLLLMWFTSEQHTRVSSIPRVILMNYFSTLIL